MTTFWTKEIQPGVRVRATQNTRDTTGIMRILEFEVHSIDSDGELLARTASGAREYTAVFPQDYAVEVIREPLPTAAGVYVDNEGDYWRITSAGGPLRYWSLGDGLQEAGAGDSPDPAAYTFTRLIPEGASA